MLFAVMSCLFIYRLDYIPYQVDQKQEHIEYIGMYLYTYLLTNRISIFEHFEVIFLYSTASKFL